jgi:hypothetical protein
MRLPRKHAGSLKGFCRPGLWPVPWYARVIFPVVPTNDAAHEAPYYDNPFCVAMWPFCEASTLYGRPECCGGVEPEFKPLRNSMIHTLAPFCCVCMPVSFGVYHFFWAISCCWCGSELPCTITQEISELPLRPSERR